MRPQNVTIDDLADAAGKSVPELWHYARNRAANYWPTRQRFTKGKHRPIDEPKPRFKEMLRGIHRFLKEKIPCHPAAHGGVKGKSYITSARTHANPRIVITRDVTKCFPSVQPQELQDRLRKLGFRSDVAEMLTLLFTFDGGVPQGSPTSTDAVNLLFWDADQRISSVCGQVGANYTRMVDDMIISVDDLSQAARLAALLEQEIRDHGLSVNRKKRDDHGQQIRGGRQRVHNLDADGSRPRITRDTVGAVRRLAEGYARGARGVAPNSLEGLARKRRKVQGHVNQFGQLDRKHASHLKKLLRHGDKTVTRILQKQGLSGYHGQWWLKQKPKSKRGQHLPHFDEPKRLAEAWRRAQS